MESLDLLVYMIIGGCVGGLLGWFLARDQIRQRLDELREETEKKARSRVEKQVRHEMGAEIREELESAYRQEAEEKAGQIVERAQEEASAARKKAELDAREIISEGRQAVDDELSERKSELRDQEQRLNRRENALDTRADRLDGREEKVSRREGQLAEAQEAVERQQEEVRERHAALVQRLEAVGDLSAEEARQALREELIDEVRRQAQKEVRRIEQETEKKARGVAQKIMAVACQRFAGDFVAEKCSSTIELPGDDMKGRIIGREGRNIRSLEAATGVDVIVDDTPEVVTVSCFDPVRREIARRALTKLVADGRIHPGRIEEVVDQCDQEVAVAIEAAGEQAAMELGLHGLHDELLEAVGRLKFRTSYGQNVWSHSIEVGFLCGLMAAELGADVEAARRAGLLHDIGKGFSHERRGSHALEGAAMAQRLGESEVVRNAIAAHHNEEEQASVIAHLVIAADALSGARPGARREVLGAYVERLEALETIAADFEGVEEAYAIRAGREIRVMVQREQVDDAGARALSRAIASRVEEELTYPGQVRVTVIRETREVGYAR